MVSQRITVQMLGSFTVRQGDREIGDHSNRMRKVWLLLAYLIYHRHSPVTQEHYLSLLRSKDDAADPAANLKAVFFRTRTLLNQLGDTAGHDLIIRKNGTYSWNTEVPLQLDVEEFDRLCREAAAAEEEDRCLELCRQALTLYQGDFLFKLSAEAWVIPIAAYYHQLYLETVSRALELLSSRRLWEEADALCQQALKIEPYSEELYQKLMRCRIAMGDRASALTLYEEMSELLFSAFGVMPSDASRAIYREAARSGDDKTIPVGAVRDLLREEDAPGGAVCCEYDFFRLLYQVQARAIVRSGEVIHIALFSIRGRGKKELSRRSLDTAAENFKAQLICNLRQGDVVSQCSVSQLVVMLPQANYEDSCKVCQRLIRAFFRQHPHAPVDIHYAVHPLEPTENAARKNPKAEQPV